MSIMSRLDETLKRLRTTVEKAKGINIDTKVFGDADGDDRIHYVLEGTPYAFRSYEDEWCNMFHVVDATKWCGEPFIYRNMVNGYFSFKEGDDGILPAEGVKAVEDFISAAEGYISRQEKQNLLKRGSKINADNAFEFMSKIFGLAYYNFNESPNAENYASGSNSFLKVVRDENGWLHLEYARKTKDGCIKISRENANVDIRIEISDSELPKDGKIYNDYHNLAKYRFARDCSGKTQHRFFRALEDMGRLNEEIICKNASLNTGRDVCEIRKKLRGKIYSDNERMYRVVQTLLQQPR